MIVKPKIRGFICTTAHPLGCSANVKDWIDLTLKSRKIKNNYIKNVLVLGGSTGYGLASRIFSSFNLNANTLNVCYEREPKKGKTASPGYYNSVAFEAQARKKGLYAKTINKDVFSINTKQSVIDELKKEKMQIDLVVYSIASPKRETFHNEFGKQVFNSVLKPIDEKVEMKALNVEKETLFDLTIEPAEKKEIENTIKVMGGEDWQEWIRLLYNNKLLSKHFLSFSFSYLGPMLTHNIYRKGTIGKAKEHLETTANSLQKEFQHLGGSICISVNKAIVTQAAAAIPILPLYITLLFKVMKEKNIHEGAMEQIIRLFQQKLNLEKLNVQSDENNLIRVDDLELNEEVQKEVEKRWNIATSENIKKIGDIQGYKQDFLSLFGFGRKDIDYNKDVDEMMPML